MLTANVPANSRPESGWAEEKRKPFMSPAEMKRVGEVLREMEDKGVELSAAIAAARLLILTGFRFGKIKTLLIASWLPNDISGGLRPRHPCQDQSDARGPRERAAELITARSSCNPRPMY